MFTGFVSNVPLGTGTNFILDWGEPKRIRARAYLRVEAAGKFDWRIYYINSVNSTYDRGALAYRNRSGGKFEIISARVADGGEIGAVDPDPSAELRDAVTITFDGSRSHTAQPDERLWSDAVRLNVPEGHYLAFEWELEGNLIPCTTDSRALTFIDDGAGMRTEDYLPCPLPAMFACRRPYIKRVAFLGDSITQGCGTLKNKYEMWAARIAGMLDGYAVWNLGMGWGRAADAATDQSWLFKAKQNDVVILTLGVNDLLHGAYGSDHGSSAGEIVERIETMVTLLQRSGVDVILSTLPPFDFTPEQRREWRAVNLALPRIAGLHGCRIYDLASALEAGGVLECKPKYGAHPDGAGGAAAAEQFYRTFNFGGSWTI